MMVVMEVNFMVMMVVLVIELLVELRVPCEGEGFVCETLNITCIGNEELCVVTASVSDPYSLNPDPTKISLGSRRPLSPDPDLSCFLTLPEINIKLFYDYKIFPSKEVN